MTSLLSPTFITGIILFSGLILLWRNKKSAKLILTAGVVLFFLLGTAPLKYSLFEMIEPSSGNITSDYKYVVVLGSGISPNDLHPLSSQIGATLLSRLTHGISLVQKNPEAKLILTGKGHASVPEAYLMNRFALEMGFPAERIILERESMNTADHPRYLKSTLDEEKFLIVTSASHMKRAIAYFEAHGLYGIPAPTDYANKQGGLSLASLIVSGQNFSAMDKWMMEIYSTLWMHAKRILGL